MLDGLQRTISLFAALILLTYATLFVSFHFVQRDNPVDKTIRPLLIQYDFARYGFFLNSYGDLRYEYLSPDTKEVLIEVDYQRGQDPDFIMEAKLREMMQKLLGKGVDIRINEEEKIANFSSFSDEGVDKILKTTRDYKPSPEQIYLHIVYLSRSEADPGNAGWSVGADEIVIFKGAISSMTERRDIIQRLEESTVKHEFGHLLGIGHNDRENCVMSAVVEVKGNYKYQDENIPTEFCGESEVILDDYRKVLN